MHMSLNISDIMHKIVCNYMQKKYVYLHFLKKSPENKDITFLKTIFDFPKGERYYL